MRKQSVAVFEKIAKEERVRVAIFEKIIKE